MIPKGEAAEGEAGAVPAGEPTTVPLDLRVPAVTSAYEAAPLESAIPTLAAATDRAEVVAAAPPPRRLHGVAIETLLLAIGGVTLVLWSFGSLVAGVSTKVTLLGIVAANLAFAGALMRRSPARRGS